MSNSKARREELFSKLLSSGGPITGSELSEIFGVSRQVIVQDIAILRAEGKEIISTPQGYLISKNSLKSTTVIESFHKSLEEIERELNIIVDLGGTIKDVIVEHGVYGYIKADLMISNRSDVKIFVEKLQSEKALPLATITDGVHFHTIEADTREQLKAIEDHLRVEGFMSKVLITE